MSSKSTVLLRAGVCAVCVAAPAAVFAAAAAPGWQTVASSKHETVSIDKSRIARGALGTTAWSRVELGQIVADPAGAYNAIEAENLYQCGEGKFTTLRRAYFHDDHKVRDEAVVRNKPNPVVTGSVDQRLLAEACKARTVGEAQVLAREAARAMTTAQAQAVPVERPSPMHADMRVLGGENSPRLIAVADAAPAVERPKMIRLPPIDKAAAEAAAAGVASRGAAAVPAAKPAPAPVVAAPPPRAVPPLPVVAEPRTVPRAVEQAAAAENRRTRELLLATSGPKRASAAKRDANPAYQMHLQWGYDGAGGPSNWANIKPEYAACAIGRRQSPIDIRDSIKVDLEPIRFDYRFTKFNIIDNGHTVQVNVGGGSTIQVMGKRYELVQFHFHKPSEERINGRPYDMVIHMVHRDYDDNLAVIAVLLEAGAENPQIQTVWNNLPLEQKVELTSNDVIDLARLLPYDKSYWTYMGSLTTPPCSENVLWMVMKQPAQISPEQIAIFGRLYRNNARPVQPGNGRMVKESR